MVYLTKEQIIKKRKVARYKFRALIRKARINAVWLSELDDLTLGENVEKNVTIILNRPKQRRGVLTIHDKAMLRKPMQERTEEEGLHLKKLFDELPCFDDVPRSLHEKLIDAVELQYFEKDRILLLQGHPALSCYFIVNGEVLIAKSEYDADTKKNISKPLKFLQSGDFFGYVGLIYDLPRNATVTSQTDVELLCVYKEEFDEILKEMMSKKHENIKAAVRRFDYFKNFTDEKIEECCLVSKVEEFHPQQTIYSQSDIKNFSYFVLSGTCMILQCLKIRIKGKGKCELVEAKKKLSPLELAMMAKLPPRETGIASMIDKGSDIKHQFIDVGTYTVGGVFGIFEEMENRVIIAKSEVQCLMIPRYWLFQKAQNIGNVWQRIKLFLNSTVPSQEKLFNNYLANQKWKKFKKKTINEIKRENGIEASATKYYNIPVICRIEDS